MKEAYACLARGKKFLGPVNIIKPSSLWKKETLQQWVPLTHIINTHHVHSYCFLYKYPHRPILKTHTYHYQTNIHSLLSLTHTHKHDHGRGNLLSLAAFLRSVTLLPMVTNLCCWCCRRRSQVVEMATRRTRTAPQPSFWRSTSTATVALPKSLATSVLSKVFFPSSEVTCSVLFA